ncbi:internalin [Acinetobacter shaoyimingii]|uniref:Internalin n=1 Tax=Acinetobacter shaoyimingii TaxID=2715164 RepID=A0A6G8RW94_9GAMM|nr:internalin [Acinetobacter shaoyimingii]QIO06068.1 internalin [Acinetobacter shaoyimingii]
MNKKLLISVAIATALLVTACVKKEAPKEDEQDQNVETTAQEPVNVEPIETPDSSEIPTRVEVEHQETNNTSATIRREYHDAPAEDLSARDTSASSNAAEAVETKPKAEAKPAESKPANPKSSSSTSQTEDDAVAAAIAAATPALDN